MQIPVVAFTSSYLGRSNVLANKVYISQAFAPSSTPISRPPNAKQYTAIWDTGATTSVITEKVANDCGLRPVSRAKVYHAKGESTTAVYLASVFLPSKVAFPQLRMIEGIIAGDAEVLIGMDVIGQGDFAVTNKDGKTVFSFRMPSIERIDFAEQIKQKPSVAAPQISKPSPKVGRNDPCPCGSGKKYKKCCGK